ncbi:hypothetical protein B7P43_G09333 [Cryptotermes secundus]|uniref:TIR domain-containing protein n=1 Tax=Cryptotermes secundus TaxID=105785 RepID=A0A2J7QTB0_9NEOP|nr:hypothetical protein B7P43_G09333 [Cryptotermes secundus]
MEEPLLTGALRLIVCVVLCHSAWGASEQQTPAAPSLRYEAPDDCQWWIRETSGSGGDEVALTCKLRTINSEFDTTNFSVIPSEHTTSLRIECNNMLMSRSSLDDSSFVHLTRLRELVLDHCKLGRWPKGTLTGLRDLRNLTVRTWNTDWPAMSLELSPESFSPVRQLERLDLSYNNIWSFPENVFCPLSNLVSLNISRNRLQDISEVGFREKAAPPQPLVSTQEEEGALAPAISPPASSPCGLDIQVLDASWNHFVLIPTNGFSTLRRLRELHLHDNEISMVADRALGGLKGLQVFDLSNNKVVALPPELFRDSAPIIKEIYLQNNSISVLAPGLFANLGHLLALDLSRNQLTSAWINSGTFSGLIRLVLLNLSHNRISRLDPTFFRDLYTLQILNLEHNQLETIPADTFAPMNNLHTLVLSYNKISYLDAYSLNGLYVLSLLSLDNNLLENVHQDAFRNCSSIQDLNLNGNTLSTVPLALKDMRLLRTVDLGENAITNLSDPGFKGMSNLYGLRLIGNQITNITKNIFADLPSLQILNLARNRIQRVEHGAFSANSDLQAIRLDANLLTDINGLFVDISSLLWLNISDNQLEWFDYALVPLAAIYNHTFSGLKRLTVLHLENNRIKELLGFELESLTSLRELYLQGNQIHVIDNRTFTHLEHLEVLRIDGNRLSTFPVWQFTLNPYLVEIGLGENQWSCDCQYLHRFRIWLQGNFVKVVDANKIACMFNNVTHVVGPPLADFNSSSCAAFTGGSTAVVENKVINDYLPLLLVTLCVFLACAGLACGAFYYRRELRVWVYSRCGLRMCYKTTAFEEEQDRDRLFDAYISYSVKDDAFVSQVLAPGLEQGDPTYRLCLHYRDFNMSAYVADTIIEAVESSRRTIVVLSKNFLHSEWCRFEFKSALHEVLKDRRRRLVIIVLGELPQRDLDPDLRLYLKTNTCIEWGDRLFWQKLKFAMPDVKKNSCNSNRESTRHHRQRSSLNLYSATSTGPPSFDRSRSPVLSPSLPLPPQPPAGKLLPAFLHHHQNNLQTAERELPRRIAQPLWA